MAQNEILQILVFSLFFGFAIASFKGKVGHHLVAPIEDLVKVMLRVTDYVMRAAPLGVFAAVAAAITVQGIGVLATYGKFIGGFYLGLLALWLLLTGAGYLFLGRRVFTLLKLIREPTILAFSTASSEAASSDMADEIHTARDGQSARTVLRTPEIRSARHSRAGGRAAGAAETRSCAIERSSVTLSWSRCIERHSVRSR